MITGITLTEIRTRARAFAREWDGETSESAEKQSFWNAFFDVFGINRRRYARFEVPVTLRERKHGKIDLFWPGLVLVEHKSTGQDLTAAFAQATHYFDGIEDKDLPRYVVVSDFAKFRLYDLDGGNPIEFALADLPNRIAEFGFLTGLKFRQYEASPQVNVEAAKLMGDLHEELLSNGYAGKPLAILLVRLMFCFFADKTNIFQTNLFRDIIETKTAEDGHDVGPLLIQIFETLDLPIEERQKNLDEDFKILEYVNGHLFEEPISTPAFNAKSRDLLLKCARFDWSAVSPAIFGAMFQRVMEEEPGKRRAIGAHYTSEKNILKVIHPQLIDPLREEFKKATTEKALNALLDKISRIKILDPACGCGNFLVIAYRELRLMELEIHAKLSAMVKRTDQKYLSVAFSQGLNVDSMYGIEIEEFPCRIAETALYLTDHLINNQASAQFDGDFRRLPLSKQPHIITDNALQLDWGSIVPAKELTAIVGNPPFIGKKARSKPQKADMKLVFGDWKGSGELDYVAAWYVKSLRYTRESPIPIAFVSTNSLTQGEQVGIFWPQMLKEDVNIEFAHRPFRWDNDASGEASVYCVIIGWRVGPIGKRLLFDYETPTSEPLVRQVTAINPYLIDFDNVFVKAKRKPLCTGIPKARFGNMANEAKPKKKKLRGTVPEAEFIARTSDQLLLTTADKDALIASEPNAARWIRRFYGSEEFIHDVERWCLWMKDITPAELRAMPSVMRRVEVVKTNRLASTRASTKRLATKAWEFGEVRQPTEPYILIPRHSSELREYVPMAIMEPASIVGDACVSVDSNDLYHLGVLQSAMHMAWMRQVCGRLESRYRYSNEIVYNNFPWPDSPTGPRQQKVREAMQAVLDARSSSPGQTLADLYDADVMPNELRKAHVAHKAVYSCYGQRAFDTDLSRVKYLFQRYATLINAGQATLEIVAPKRTRKKRPRST